jgi:hypothetical protein
MRTRRFVVKAISIVILLGLAGCYNEEEAIAENQTIAHSITMALEHYEQTYGAYPDTLDELSSEFIAQIPLTVDGEEFRYHNYADSEIRFRLAFSVNADCGCGYEAKFEVWECSSDPE